MSKHPRKGITLRHETTSPSIPFENVWEEYLEHTRNLLPHTTACALLGVDDAKYGGWIVRYPLLRDKAKQARAEGIRDAQQSVRDGEPGWQAKMRLLESIDPDNWLRPSSSGRKANDTSPYASALTSARRRSRS